MEQATQSATKGSPISNIDNIGIIADDVTQIGDYVAGRDLHITENKIAVNDLKFSDVNLEPYKDYIAPKFTNHVFNRINEQQILLIGGSYEFDKNVFARHLAYVLSITKNDYQVKEWIDKTKSFSLFASLASEKKPTIFILNQLNPSDVKYDIERFRRLALDHSHYFVLTTDLPIDAWKLSVDQKAKFWFEIPQKDIFSREVLIQVLTTELEEHWGQLNFADKQPNISQSQQLTPGYSIQALATELGTISKIQIFVQSLVAANAVISDNVVSKILDKLNQSNEKILKQWFNNLDPKLKEAVLALSIFDGFFDDQFFVATERLFNTSWQKRGSKLVGLDYYDLDVLMSFFGIEEINFYKRIIKSKHPNFRIELFKVIWDSHRRQLLSALPTMVALVEDSVVNVHKSIELFGSEDRVNRLQSVISDTMSDLGIIHFNVVENAFLQLASSDQKDVQEVAAKALSRWRNFDKEEQLFKVIHKWQDESRIRDIISEILGANTKTVATPDSLIRATLVLTLGYAAEYDKPNELSSKLVDIFDKFSKDENKLVKERFKTNALPKLTANHLVQLKNHLFKLLNRMEFVPYIAYGIAICYKDYPDDVYDVLVEWLNYCEINRVEKTVGINPTHRDKVLVTVIHTLSQLKYKEENALNAAQAYRIISELQQTDYHYPVQNRYIKFIENQIIINGAKINAKILPVIENLSFKTRPKLTQFLSKVYFTQRLKLTGEEDFMSFRKKKLPIWISNPRPFTDIEETMVDWLKSDSQIAQQVAMETFYEFTLLVEIEENQHIERIIYERENQEDEEEKTEPIIEADAKITNVTHNLKSRIIAWFSLWNYSPATKNILRNLIPVLVKNDLKEQQNMNLIGQKLKAYDVDSLNQVSNYVEGFPLTLRIYKGLVIVGGACVIYVLFLLFNL